MSVNKYKPHVWLIPEDDAYRQLAVGFLNHDAVADQVVGLRAPAGGWGKVSAVLGNEYLTHLRRYPGAHVVMLIDFDEIEERRAQFAQSIPGDVSARVFRVGAKDEAETLRSALGMALERIGQELAQDCLKEDLGRWGHPHLAHNHAELQRMVQAIKPILFRGN